MPVNELLLIGSVVLIYGAVLCAWKLFGATGLYCLSALIIVVANIEVMILVEAFGIEQTLGNVLFAATFLITDILSECRGRQAANKCVWIGFFVSVFFLILSQSWLLYVPSPNDTIAGSISAVFANTPRMMFASLSVYLVSQLFDVWLYHFWWGLTERKSADKERFLWLRNNGSTLISQLINTVLFNVIAFWGTYETSTLVSIIISCYAIYIVTSLLDTPIVYAARAIAKKRGDMEKPCNS